MTVFINKETNFAFVLKEVCFFTIKSYRHESRRLRGVAISIVRVVILTKTDCRVGRPPRNDGLYKRLKNYYTNIFEVKRLCRGGV